MIHSHLFINHIKMLASLLVTSGLMVFSPISSAATIVLRAETPATAVQAGHEFSVSLFVDTDQPLNAYSIGLSYPKESMELVRFDNSRSIIDVWQSQPVVYESGYFVFKGGSTRSFEGQKGELLTMSFKAFHEGAAAIHFVNPALYLANGKGTKVIPQITDAHVSIVAAVVGEVDALPAQSPDVAPPEIVIAEFIADPVNADQKFLTFQANDTGSGVRSATVRSRNWFFWRDALVARNPTAFPLHVWASRLEIYDNAGNVARRTVYDWRAFAVRQLPLYIAVLVGALIFIRRTIRQRRNIIKEAL